MAKPTRARRAELRTDTKRLIAALLRNADPGLLTVAGLTEEETAYVAQYLTDFIEAVDPDAQDDEE